MPDPTDVPLCNRPVAEEEGEGQGGRGGEGEGEGRTGEEGERKGGGREER